MFSTVMRTLFSGDTEKNQRLKIRETSHVIFTNPDMLHVSILPNHVIWERFLAKVRIIVIDELHAFVGNFGVHCSFVIKRLRRICQHYGNGSIQFVGCSATLSEPEEVS